MKVVNWLLGQGSEKIQTVVHVGAHRGQELDAYLQLNPEQIVFIEADPVTYSKLNENMLARHGAIACRLLWIHALVGDVDGVEVPFYRFNNNGASSSLFRATKVLRDKWEHIGLDETGSVPTLLMRRLDSIFQSVDFFIQRPSVLVLDIQGAELAALRGLGNQLEAFDLIEVEVSLEQIYDGAPLFPVVDAFLSEHGFEKQTPVPWHGDVVYQNERGSGPLQQA